MSSIANPMSANDHCTMMKLWIGSSGFSYRGWVGDFYPRKRAQDMLGFYSTQFQAVEINNTFYRQPRKETLQSWSEQVPRDFKFALKAPRAITHIRMLYNVDDDTKRFLQSASVLQNRLGALLFQLPPRLKVDLARLDRFLDLLRYGQHVAFEFRHPSWLIDNVFEVLCQRNCALCWTDTGSTSSSFIGTADWGYIRLRQSDYDTSNIDRLLRHIKQQNWRKAFIFAKHEKGAHRPIQAERFKAHTT